jgi:hypothetical protein
MIDDYPAFIKKVFLATYEKNNYYLQGIVVVTK